VKMFKRQPSPPPGSFFLFGPRGTGKTTWLKTQYPKACVVDLLSVATQMTLSARPDRLREIVMGNLTGTDTFVIDEVQKVPELLSVVHQLMEEYRHIRFAITGSSARKLKRAGVDLLAGRAALRHLHPLTAGEMQEQFNLEAALQFGLLPVVVSSPSPADALAAYVGTYLREELLLEGLLRNLGAFSRYLEVASFSQGAFMNASEVARECAIDRRTVNSYTQMLEDMMLAFSVPIFSKRAKRLLVSHAKFYLFDAGVFRMSRPKGPLDTHAELDGLCLETLVAEHLRAWADYTGLANALYHWRTKAGNEVDFIVYGEDVFAAIEVKNSSSLAQRDFRGLRSFREDYPEAAAFLVYRGRERLLRDEVLCLPCAEFLASLSPGVSINRLHPGRR